jgi:hypothetical protein
MRSILLLPLTAALLAGCVWPHTTERAAEVGGRVLDARTHAPVPGAEVYLVVPPHHTERTDAAGYFHFKAVHQFHYGYVPPEGQWPDRKNHIMEITHPGYKPLDLDPGFSGSNYVGDILLTPRP